MTLAPIVTFLAIFLLRVVNVSLATARQIIIVRGYKYLGAVMGFFEVLIFILAISKVLNDGSWSDVVAYCLGFAVGTIAGAVLEDRLALGYSVIRIFTHKPVEVGNDLRSRDFGVTETAGEGREGAVAILELVVRRKEVQVVRQYVQHIDQRAFITVEQPLEVKQGHFMNEHKR